MFRDDEDEYIESLDEDEEKNKDKDEEEKISNKDFCRECKQPHTDGRKKKRLRMCRRCRNEANVKRRRKDPLIQIARRFYGFLKRHYGSQIVSPDLYSKETVKRILDRWENKSAIDGTTDGSLLCITLFRKVAKGTQLGENDFVVVTIKESNMLSKIDDNNLRAAKFLPEVMLRFNLLKEDE